MARETRKSRFRDNKDYSQQLQERTEAASNLKSGKYKPIFKEGVKFDRWICREGDHEIDIIPFRDADDKAHYKVELLVHNKVGPNENNYICPKTWDAKAPCGVCDGRAKILTIEHELAEKVAGKIDTKERVIYNIVCYDTRKEEDKGVQIWDASAYLAEQNFKAQAKQRKTGGTTKNISFSDPDEGRRILFERKGKEHLTRYEGVQFDERPPIDDEILDEAYDIFELLYDPSDEELVEAGEQAYAEVQRLIAAEEDGGPRRSRRSREEDEDPPRRSRRSQEEDSPRQGRNRPESREDEERGRGSRRADPPDDPPEEKEETRDRQRRQSRPDPEETSNNDSRPEKEEKEEREAPSTTRTRRRGTPSADPPEEKEQAESAPSTRQRTTRRRG